MKLMTGYRMFKFRNDGLYPVGLGERWGYHSNEQRAQCTHVVDKRDTLLHRHTDAMPDKNCSCGYYAFREAERIIDIANAFLKTEVEPEGRVELFEEGWRAEYMRVTKIWWPECADFCGKPALHIVEVEENLVQYNTTFNRDPKHLVAYCSECRTPGKDAEPVLNYLNRLKIQYDCEITEATWTSEHTSGQSKYRDAAQFGKLMGQTMAAKRDAAIFAAMKNVAFPSGSASPSPSSKHTSRGPACPCYACKFWQTTPQTQPSPKMPWDILSKKIYTKELKDKEKRRAHWFKRMFGKK